MDRPAELSGSLPVTTTVLRCPRAVSSARRFFTSSSACRWVTNRPIRWDPVPTDQPYCVCSTTNVVVVARLATTQRSTPGRQLTRVKTALTLVSNVHGQHAQQTMDLHGAGAAPQSSHSWAWPAPLAWRGVDCLQVGAGAMSLKPRPPQCEQSQ